MAHCIRTFTEEISDYSRKLVGIVQHIEGGEQIVEDGIGMAHTEHVCILFFPFCLFNLFILFFELSIIIAQLQCASTVLDAEHKVLKMFWLCGIYSLLYKRVSDLIIIFCCGKEVQYTW